MENTQQQTCSFCGAEKVHNPKTGKWFCKEKCWLNKSQAQNNSQPAPTNGDINWDKVEDHNNKKTDSMTELNAKKIAGEYANLMLELQHITPDQWDKTFQDKANEIFNINF